jgi:ribosomal protein S21
VSDTEKWISAAAKRARAKWVAEVRLRRAFEEGGEKKVRKEAERLQEAWR